MPSVKPISWSLCLSSAVQQSKATFFGIVATYVVAVLLLRGVLGTRHSAGKLYSGADAEIDRSLMADLLAYNLISLIFAIYCGMIGLRTWFGPAAKPAASSPMDRLYVKLPACEKLGIVTTAYEAFNCVATVALPEYRTVAFIGHHLTTLALGVCGFHPVRAWPLPDTRLSTGLSHPF